MLTVSLLTFLVAPSTPETLSRHGRGPTRLPGPQSLPAELADLDEASVALFRAFGNALRLHRQFMTGALGESDVHPGQGICLNVLARHDGIAQRDLAEAMHVAPPTLSRMLRSMETGRPRRASRGRVDQRLTRVYLSDAGRALAERRAPRWRTTSRRPWRRCRARSARSSRACWTS